MSEELFSDAVASLSWALSFAYGDIAKELSREELRILFICMGWLENDGSIDVCSEIEQSSRILRVLTAINTEKEPSDTSNAFERNAPMVVGGWHTGPADGIYDMLDVLDQSEYNHRWTYTGQQIRPDMYHLYLQCVACGYYVWHSSCVLEMCPPCIITLPKFNLEISFERSTSTKYGLALRRARRIQTYESDGERHVIRFDSLGRYCNHRKDVEALMLIIFRWKSTAITLNGIRIHADGLGCIYHEINRIRDRAGAADITFYNGRPIFVLPG